MQNNRKYERYDLTVNVHLKDRKGTHLLETGNISKYGLFLVLPDPRPKRQLIQLVIEFPEHADSIEVLAQVMWSDPVGDSNRGDGRPGMGVKFFSMPDEARGKWEAFVESIRTGKYVPPPSAKTKKAKVEAEKDSSVYTIGEEELEELEGLDTLDELSSEDEEIIDIEEEPIEDVAVQDISSDFAEYEQSGSFSVEDLASDIADLEPIEIEEVNANAEDERREYPRKPVSFMVRIRDVDTMRDLLTRDISLGGMFIKTMGSYSAGDKIKVVIVHPWTHVEFALDAEVRRIEQNSAGNAMGVGVKFMHFNDDRRDTMLTYIESGYVIVKTSEDVPIEAEIIRRIEEVETSIHSNPINAELHYEVGLLYLSLSDWENSNEHMTIASKLGHDVPPEIFERLEGKL